MSRINEWHGDKWELVVSNIPVPSTSPDINLEVINNFVKNFVLPDYNLEYIESNFRDVNRKNPNSKYNNDLTPFTVEFTADEDLDNYFAFYNWMLALRSRTPLKGETTQANSTIKDMTIITKDNEERNRNAFSFKDCLLVNLSSLSIVYGSTEPMVFSCTFVYSDFRITRNLTNTNN